MKLHSATTLIIPISEGGGVANSECGMILYFFTL